MTEPRGAFTGRARRHQNRWRVRASDAVARSVITVGGIATIVAVLLVFVFLLAVVVPLFWPAAELTTAGREPLAIQGRPVALGIDEYRLLGWTLDESGQLHVFRPDTGETLADRPLLSEGRIASISPPESGGGDAVVGLADGSIRIGTITFQSDFVAAADVLPQWQNMRPGEARMEDDRVIQRTQQGQWRVLRLDVRFLPAWQIADSPIERLDHLSSSDSGPTVVAWSSHGAYLVTTKRNELTGEVRQGEVYPLPTPEGWTETPLRVLLTGGGDNVFLVSRSGQVARIGIRDPSQAKVVEQVPLIERGQELTRCEWILGRETMICADNQGGLRAWFRVPMAEGGGEDGWSLVAAHTFSPDDGAPSDVRVTASDASQRSRLVAIGRSDGRLDVYQVTAERQIAELQLPTREPVAAVRFSPKDDGLLAWADNRLWRLDFNPRHAEVTWQTLYGMVWYENYQQPAHVWQSSFAGVESEPKLGLMPLVFGTLKATLYSMLFGAPLALMAAVHASEFMSPRLRSQVKPTVEMMASLPSVVLGFLAALVLAPIVETHLASVVGTAFTLPAALLIGAQLWQLLPATAVPYLAPYRILAIGAAFVIGLAAGVWVGPPVADVLFAGDLMAWLDGRVGTATGGWVLLLLPATSVATALGVGSLVNPVMRSRWGGMARTPFALLNLAKFILAAVVAVGLAWTVASLLTAAGIDPRGSLVDTYVQRNALVVGFVMGFAIIPLVFTIADDALTTVPQHLRSASLGAGATPWQTAVRVVIPTAMSGLFSALMIGLGRAVGETMIVLMAGGNTPVMEWNMFNGFRTLSANIAVELPEAVRGSSHYRTLFLAALTLFLLTFVVNTVAEFVRIRFRKRAYQL